MNVAIFNRLYWIRRFSKQRNIKGYLVSDYTDFGASLHIHPTGSDTMQALPEGQRKVKRLEGHGMEGIIPADEKLNQKGDLLYYYGDWYECVSSQLFDHTVLNHRNYQFVLVPTDAAGSIDLKPPVGDPVLTVQTPPVQDDLEGEGSEEP